MPLADSTDGIRAILFDVDGTLVDTLPALVPGLGDAYESYLGYRPDDAEIRSVIGLPLSFQMQMYEAVPPSEAELRRRIDFAIGQFEHYKDRERVFTSSVRAMVHLQQSGFRIALVTSKSRVELDSFLSRFDAAPFVDAAVCSSDVLQPKPHAESALLACERLNVRPQETLLIGDSIFDMQCARNAGLAAAIAVAYGSGVKDALLAEQPDLILDHPDAVLEWAHQMSRTPCLEARS